MRYEGKKCPVCGEKFTVEDDVVVCPVCAAPHHRACYKQQGCCANEARHDEGFVWTPSGASSPDPEPDTTPAEQVSLDIQCPDCGTVSPNGTSRCPECGALLIPDFGEAAKQAPEFFREVAAAEDIDGVTAVEYAAYVAVNPRYYLKTFKKFVSGKKFAFNVGAFFLSPFWFFFRKLYRQGLIFLIISLTAIVALMPQTGKFLDKYDTMITVSQDSEMSDTEFAEYFASEASELYELATPVFLLFAFLFAVNLTAGFIASRIYYNHARSDILTLKEHKESDSGFRLAVVTKGGVSILAALVSLIGYRLIMYTASYFIN